MTDQDAALRQSLRRHRAFATALLALMAALMLLAYALPHQAPWGWWADLLQASAKAGFVGGLADWFAVTALFRHPLGLPIPHTAIIPRQKERLGRGLGRFVATQVFTEAEMRRVLARLDLAAILRGFLADPEATRPAAQAMAQALPRLLDSVADGRAHRLISRLLPRLLGGAAGGRVVARALRALVAGNRHQEVFDLLITQLRSALSEKEDQLKTAIEQRVRQEGGKLVGWLAGASVARRVIAAVNAELDGNQLPDGALRVAFEEWLMREIERLENEPDRAAAVGQALRGALAHPAATAWFEDIWTRLRAAIASDAARPDGHGVRIINGALANAATLLAEDEAVRSRLNKGAEAVLLRLLPSAQTELADFIARVVAGWDTRTVTEKLELRVGRDLQFVRINGTLVGFVVGGALFALLHALFGRVAS